jgi:very-short-patch-repair endonuclease
VVQPRTAQQSPDDTPLARLAARQHGVVSRGQLLELGYSKERIHTLVMQGVLLRMHRGVYAVGHRRLTLRGRWLGAVLGCGDGARLSHRDAAMLWDLRRTSSGLIHVTATAPHRVDSVCCHRTRRPDRLGPTIIDAVPVTSLERTLLDLAAEESHQRTRALLEAAERRRLLDAHAILAEIDASNGHRGTARLAAALAEVADEPPELRSGLEARFLTLIREAGLPEPLTNTIVEGVPVDAYWPAHRLVVEVDGWDWHRSRRSFVDDRIKRNLLTLAGLTVLVFEDTTLASAPAEIRSAIAGAGRPSSAASDADADRVVTGRGHQGVDHAGVVGRGRARQRQRRP